MPCLSGAFLAELCGRLAVPLRPALRLVLAGAALLCMGTAAQADEAAMTPVLLGPNTYAVRLDGAAATNAGFVVTANAVVLVDAPDTPALAMQLLDEIRRITPKPVSHVLLTRFDRAHAGGLEVLKAAGAAIVARRPALAELAAGPEPTPVDLALEDGTDLLIGGVHIQAVLAGSAPGDEGMLYFFPDEGVLYTGDLGVSGRVPEVGSADTRRWIALLDELLALDARVLVPGQGDTSNEPRAALQTSRDHLATLCAERACD